jgi:hypothetical protein
MGNLSHWMALARFYGMQEGPALPKTPTPSRSRRDYSRSRHDREDPWHRVTTETFI